MNLSLAATAALLAIAACSQAESGKASCIKRADENFDQCIKEGVGRCALERVRELEICDRQ